MRTMTQALLALGFVGAMAVGIPTMTVTTAKAQGVSIYGPGYEVDIGSRPYYRDRRYYRDYNNSYGAYGGHYPGRGSSIYRDGGGNVFCYRRGFTVQDGVCKPYRGY